MSECAICLDDDRVALGLCFKHRVEFYEGKGMSTTDGMPTFNSFEEMQAFLKKGNTEEVLTPLSKLDLRRGPTHPVDAGKLVGQDVQAVVEPRLIMSSLHFYKRTGDNYESVLKDAKEKLGRLNANELVFAHDHIFGAECVERCRQCLN